MLKDILTSKTCGKCRNCCVFFSKSRWEMPTVSKENVQKIRELLKNENSVEKNGEVYKLRSVLRENMVDENAEEYKCPALDESKGCTLPIEVKPLECSMWPLRVMNDNDRIYVTLAKGCHAVDDEFRKNAEKLLENGLRNKITEILKNTKDMIREYDDSYIKLCDITEEI